MEILEALLNLNRALMMEGYESDYSIYMRDKDFERFVCMFEQKFKYLISYPDLSTKDTLKTINVIKIAGPGSYFIVKRA